MNTITNIILAAMCWGLGYGLVILLEISGELDRGGAASDQAKKQ